MRAENGTGSKRTMETNGATLENPLAKEFAATLPRLIEGNMNLKNTKATAETTTLTHHGHPTNKFSMDSSLRPIEIPHRITRTAD